MSILRQLKQNFKTKPLLILNYLKRNTLLKSCYHTEYISDRKSQNKILYENVRHILKYGEINDYYFLYGFDINGFRDEKKYIAYRNFMKIRNKNNKYPFNYDIGLLRNKFYFSLVGEKLGFPVINNRFIIENGLVSKLGFSCEDSLVEFRDFLNNYLNFQFFIKTLNGECGDGVYSLEKKDGELFLNDKLMVIDEVVDVFSNTSFIIQERIIQHSSLNKLYGKSINTIRITTVKKSIKSIVCSPAVLRVGAHGNNVDNWARGGIIIPITSEGKLEEFGFYKPGYGGKVNLHPDSSLNFKGFEVPYFFEAVKVVSEFHKFIDVHSIGWDVAITESGPIIIEGNDNWEVTLPQVIDGFEGFMKEHFKF